MHTQAIYTVELQIITLSYIQPSQALYPTAEHPSASHTAS